MAQHGPGNVLQTVSAESTLPRNALGAAPEIIRNHTLDSTRWNSIPARDGDIVICTWAKSGTTWLQQIVAQLIFGSSARYTLGRVSPWVDNRCFSLRHVRAALEAQEHRRFLKTHLPATALPYREGTRYLFVGRDGRDAVCSWHNHHLNLDPAVYEIMRKTPGCVGPQLEPPVEDLRLFFLEWLARDGHPLWPFWSHVRSWWEIRHLPNVLLMHFDDLKRDLRGSVHRIAGFLDLESTEDGLDLVAERSSFAYMKKHAAALLPEYERGFAGGAGTFINRGEGGRWHSALTPNDISAYEQRMLAELGEKCAAWLARPYGIGMRQPDPEPPHQPLST